MYVHFFREIEKEKFEQTKQSNLFIFTTDPTYIYILLYEIAQNIIRPSRAAYVHRRLCPHQHVVPDGRSSFVTLILLLLLSDTYKHVITLALAPTLITAAQRAQSEQHTEMVRRPHLSCPA